MKEIRNWKLQREKTLESHNWNSNQIKLIIIMKWKDAIFLSHFNKDVNRFNDNFTLKMFKQKKSKSYYMLFKIKILT